MRKICVFTSTRADYGLLRPLMEEIKSDEELILQILASGSHLSPEFGLTFEEIEKDGFLIDEKSEMLLSSDTPVGISKAIGLGVISYSEALERLNPDIAVILGDRFEALAFAIACSVSRIPIAHIHGGEVTEGAVDDAFRHSITKMSYLHFAAAEAYRTRIIQLGENPNRTFDVGALGIDNIKKLNLLSKKGLEKEINYEFNKHNLLVTFHPITLEKNTSREQFGNLLEVLDELPNTSMMFTKANADTDGRIINSMIDEYVSTNPKKAVAFMSMGYLRYLSAMQFVDAVVGNSSSGILEAPSFKIGTINIGDRQTGRIKAESIIDSEPTKNGLKTAFKKLYSPEFQNVLGSVVNPYDGGDSATKMKEILKNHRISDSMKKVFWSL